MKLAELKLLAFGPFTDVTLDLSGGAQGLHVIHGPNEAGKSSALSAVTNGLYGFAHRKEHDFVHRAGALRIGMVLDGADGVALACVRRRGRKDTLRDGGDDKPVQESELRRMLGGVDQEEFVRAFGLSYADLSAGSRELLQEGGAASLTVGAGLGLNSIRKIAAGLRGAAEALYTGRPSKRPINAALAELKNAEADLRAAELSRGALEDAERVRNEAVQRHAKNKERLLGLRREADDLGWALGLHGVVAEYQELAGQLKKFAGVPALPEDFGARWQSVQSQLARFRSQRDSRKALVEDAEGKLARCRETFPLVDRAEEIRELRQLAMHPSIAPTEIVRQQKELEQARVAFRGAAAVLGMSSEDDVEERVGQLRVKVAGCQRLGQLVKEWRDKTTLLVEAESELAPAGGRAEDAAKELHELASSEGVNELSAAVDSALELKELAKGLPHREDTLAKDRKAVADDLAALPGFSGGVEALRAAQVPGPQVMQEFRQRYESLSRFADEIEAGRRAAQRALDDAAADAREIQSRRAGGPLDGSQLHLARSERQKLWGDVKNAWSGGVPPGEELPMAYEGSVERADELADGLRDNADAAAQLREAQLKQSRSEQELETLQSQQQELDKRWASWRRDWEQAWHASGFAAGGDGEIGSLAAMEDVLARREAILGRDADLEADAGQIRSDRKRVAAAANVLQRHLGEAGRDASSGDIDLLATLSRANSRKQELEALAAKRLTLEAQKKSADDALRKARAKRSTLAEDVGRLEKQILALVAELPGGDKVTPDAAEGLLDRVEALLESWDGLQDAVADLGKTEDLVESIAKRVRGFCAIHAEDLVDQDMRDAAESLWDRLQRDEREFKERDALEDERESRKEKLEEAEASLKALDKKHKTLMEEARVEAETKVLEQLQRSRDAEGLRTRFHAKEAALREHGELQEVIQRVCATLDAYDVPREKQQELAAEIEDADALVEKLQAQSLEQQSAWDRLQKQKGAGAAAEDIEALKARIASLGERYAILQGASLLLERAVHRAREAKEAPLMRTASKRLEQLTQGRYDRIETDLDENNDPFFRVRMAGGNDTKTVDQLSSGTRDQLYLSLVLGGLERRFQAGGEPLPLILDDVLVHFDDDRAVAALEALADFSSLTQVILFTHHGRIRDEAAALGEAKGVFVHEL